MQAEAFGRASLAGAGARRTAARRNSTAFYQSLNHARRIVIGSREMCFWHPKTRPEAGRSGRGETPLDTPGGVGNTAGGNAWRGLQKHRRRNARTGFTPG